jgi:hypothetical protein
MAMSVLTTEANIAPPAALLPPGLHVNDDENAMLWLKLQLKNVKFVDRVTAGNAAKILGYTYDSNNVETAPPKEMASFESPDVDDMLLQCAQDTFMSSMIHEEINTPETNEMEPPALYE